MSEVHSGGGFMMVPVATAEIERMEALWGGLTDVVRGLVDATIRSTVDEAEVERARRDIEAVVARLRSSQVDGPAGVHFNDDGRSWNWETPRSAYATRSRRHCVWCGTTTAWCTPR